MRYINAYQNVNIFLYNIVDRKIFETHCKLHVRIIKSPR